MGVIRAAIAVLVVLAAAYAAVLILAEGRPKEKSACSVASNIILPYGGTQAVPCCEDDSGGCLPGLESSLGSVALIPSKLSKDCPAQLLSAAEAAPAFVAPSIGSPGTVDTVYLGRQYQNQGCGDIQVGLTSYCAEPGLESSLGSVALIPSKLSKDCPAQLLSAAEAAPAFVAPSIGSPGTVDTVYLGRQYQNQGCGDIQVGLTSYCAEPGADVSSCTGGIAAVESGRSATVACPAGGGVQEMRRTLFPSDLGDLSESCSYKELGVASAPVPRTTLDPQKDADGGGCEGHPLTEALFYQCV